MTDLPFFFVLFPGVQLLLQVLVKLRYVLLQLVVVFERAEAFLRIFGKGSVHFLRLLQEMHQIVLAQFTGIII
jgi:hypothetical protein